jgi:hypothetical protein
MNATAAAYPSIAQVVDLTVRYNLPPTYEGRHLYALKISDNVALEEDEPAILIVSCHHCREINTPVVTLDAISRLTSQYGLNPTITAAVNLKEIWIAPVWNPDGYEYVFNTDNNWRKNRRPVGGGAIGVDLNRNYPLGWSSACAGSTTPSSQTYKGPSAASEAETQTMLAFGNDRHFEKVMDFHSYGQETLWGYQCLLHPFATWLQGEAAAIATASGYGGMERPPSAEGEHQQWQAGLHASYGFLTEIGTQFQPSYASAVAEANLIWPGTLYWLTRPTSIHGHVTDLCTGAPLQVAITYSGVTFTNGEVNNSDLPNGRYHAFLPPGTYNVTFASPGYSSQNVSVTVGATTSQQLDIALAPAASVTAAGTAQIGTLLTVNFDIPLDAGLAYLGGCSVTGTVPGTPINGCTLPLNVDAVTLLSIQDAPPFSGFAGILNAQGHGAGTVALPQLPALIGVGFDFAALTYNVTPFALRHVTPSAHVIVQP